MTRPVPESLGQRLAVAVSLVALVLALGACTELQSEVPEFDATVEVASLNAIGQRYLVVAQPSVRPAQVARVIAAAGGVVARELPSVGVYAAVSTDDRFLDTIGRHRLIAAAGRMPYVEVPDVVVGDTAASLDVLAPPNAIPDPPAFYWGYQWGVARVNAPAAWGRGFTGSHDTVVAIIDTGIASNHPDVGPNIVHEACFTVAPGCIPYPSLHFHGTHVAGTVAATFGYGVVGVGPNLGLANYNVFELFEVEPGEFAVLASDDSIFAAMLDAAEQGFEVINMSLGSLAAFGPGLDNRAEAAWRTAYKRVVDRVVRAGTVIVASAGNAAFDLTGPALNLPGGTPGIVNVGATGIRPNPVYPQPGGYDVLAFYSNFGAPVDIAAPGGDCGVPDGCDPPVPANYVEYLVLSSYVIPDPVCAQTRSCPVSWAWTGGTSMAAPHVAGVAGLLRDAEPKLSPRQVVARLLKTADDIGPRLTFGHGMVDADGAIP
jgi:lantibiotic leader peptide-processing serine protease